MKNKHLRLILSFLLLCTVLTSQSQNREYKDDYNTTSANSCMLGSNLSGYKGWPTQFIFINLAHHAVDWFPPGEIVWKQRLDRSKLTKDGLKAGETGQLAIFWDMDPWEIEEGRYVITYKGTGNVKIEARNLNITIIEEQKGRIEFDLTKNGNDAFFFFHVLTNDKNDNIREIRMTEKKYENSTQVFRDGWINDHRTYGMFRFMDWMGTNTSFVKTWADYSSEKSAYQRVTAFHYMIELCNQLQADAWFCVPHQANDDFVTKMAQQIKSELDPNLKVYVEYTNEAWNGLFGDKSDGRSGQFTYMYQQAKIYYPNMTDEHDAARRYFARRNGEIFNIFDQVFGNEKGRLVRVVGGFVSNSWVNNNILEHYNDIYNKVPDALAIAPYVGNEMSLAKHTSTIANWGLNEVFRQLRYGDVLNTNKSSLPDVRERIKTNKGIADKWGVELLGYEGGQHLTSGYHEGEHKDKITQLFTDANRDQRMYDFYIDFYDMWVEEGGSVFANFADVGFYSVFGSWGAKEYGWQTRDDAPKFAAILDWIDQNCDGTVSCSVLLSESGFNFSTEAGSNTVTVTTTESFTVSDDQDWITVSKNGNQATITVTKNTGSDSRSGTVTISGCSNKTISITQDGQGGSGNPGSCATGEASFLQSAGEVVIEAENFNNNSQNTDNVQWKTGSAQSGFSGSGYVYIEEGAVNNDIGNPSSNAGLSYQIEFVTAGTYTIWVRRWAPDGAGNSVFAALGGAQSTEFDNTGDNGMWVWKSLGTVNVAGPAVYELELIRREDGYLVDKIVVNSGEQPSAEGPGETTCVPTGITEADLDKLVNIYPNPAQDVAVIQIAASLLSGPLSIELRNYLGQTVQTIDQQGEQVALNTSELPQGIYYVLVQTGKERVIKKLVISK